MVTKENRCLWQHEPNDSMWHCDNARLPDSGYCQKHRGQVTNAIVRHTLLSQQGV